MATVTKPMALDETLKATNVALGLIKDAINATGAYPSADNISYDNTTSGLSSTNVQSAINELEDEKADKSTTLNGYGITNAYTKTETNSLLNNKANISDIPSKTSDLTNDSNFVSDSNYVHTDNNYTTTDKNIVDNVTSNLANKVDKVNGKSLSTNDFTTAYMNKLNGIASGAEVNVQSDWSQTTTTKDDYIKNKPTKLSDFTNDQNFIDNTVNNLTNYYLKSNTYTKTEVNNLIGSIVTLNIVVVQALPTTNISQTTIYLVPKSTTQTNNAYDEYINLDGTTSGWEKIGDTEIDLSNYYTISQVDNLLSNKVDKVSGKGLSTNDFTNDLKTKLNGIANGAEVNVQADWSQTTTTNDSYIKNKPTKLSEFTNDSKFITNAVSNLTNYYTKSNTYTKTEVDNLIATIVTLNILIVQTLPTSDISTTTIYLVPKTTSETNNVYDEYINIDGTTQGWEKIGDTSVDLSNYYTISQVDTLLSNKVDKVSGKGLSTNDFTTTLKNKLNGIEANANNYSLPTSSSSVLGGVKIGSNLSINSDGVVSATNTTYSDVTTTTHGLMTASDKVKLNGIESNANNYSLPIAGSSTLGGVKVGTNLSINSSGVLSATDTTYSNATTSVSGLMSASDKTKLNGIESEANKYVLPTATSSALGGIKVGSNLSIDANGVVSATNTTYSDATTTTHGLMSATDKTKLDGIASGANKYTLPKATASALGGIKIGTNLSIDSNGVVSATDTKYSNATTSAGGLMSATDKVKLNGIATGAEVNVQADWDETDTTKDSYIKNKPNIPSGVVVDTSLSTTSVNPVQNKVITTELNKKANASSVPTNSAIIDLIYPVGSIYTSTINKNPSTYFGGTWSSIGESYLIINNGTTNTTQYKWKRTA